MRIFLLLGLLLLARPVLACPDLLLGDSYAQGMAAPARAAGFEVVAQQGAGIAWLRQQAPRCVGRLVLVVGTNDLRGVTPGTAAAYLRQIAAAMEPWPAERIIWAMPGCFARDPALEQGSAALDRAATAALAQADDALRYLPALQRGRATRCGFASADGVHPAASVYRDWWAALLLSVR